ncbi:MAG TPA: chromosome segregation protein SMC [Armatimonadota bacterium]|nr:chromosome segregation protein SMC [Armatimonadota bacterium]
MHLKRLELCGFKTFADRTNLEFGPGVSAIVGPNGSGKSNIADAILWVLGEQSMKTLRSQRAQDVIFSGTAGRRRVGFAEAHLTLDNSDRGLPLDFTEVTVTRRVFRSGEGEYLINGVPCRLRDIHDLFMDTGIGRQAYSVINQNEVDAILSIRSEDRRALIEEAAGVQKYRHRKEEAQRKLGHTEQNLLRLSDIINELESQVEPLAQQAEHARSYRELSRELSQVKRALLVDEHQAACASIERARQRELDLAEELHRARTEGETLAAAEAALRAELQQAELELEELRTVAARTASEAQRAQADASLREERLRSASARREQLQQEIEQTSARIAQAAADLEGGERERAELADRSAQLATEIAHWAQTLCEVEARIPAADQAVEAARRDYLVALDAAAAERNRLHQCQSLRKALEQRVQRLQERLTTAQEACRTATASAAEAAARIEQLTSERAAAQTEMEQAAAARIETSAALAALERDRGDLREAISAAAARLQALCEMNNGAGADGAKALLEAAGQGRLPGPLQALRAVLQPRPGMEIAVEAALGIHVHGVIAHEEETAAASVRLLRASDIGRASVVVCRAGATTGLDPRDLPGCLGTAAGVVECPPWARPAVERLLGKILIVGTPEAARSLTVCALPWEAIVTVDGEVTYPSGVVVAGRPGAGPLRRAREMEELERQLAELRSRLDEVTRTRDDAGRWMEDLAVAEASASEHVQRCREGLERRRKEREAAAEQLARLHAEREGVESELASLGPELEQARADEHALTPQAEQANARQQQAEEALATAEETASSERAQRESMAQELMRLRLESAGVEGRINASRIAAAKVAQTREQLGAELEADHALLAQAEARVEELNAIEQDATQAIERLTIAAQARQVEVERAKDRRQGLLEAISAKLEGQKERAAAAEELQGRLHRSELRTTQLHSEIGFLERTLQEEFGLEIKQALLTHTPVPSREQARLRVRELEAGIAELGEVNLGAVEEYDRVRQRLEFLSGQRADMIQARDDIQRIIAEISDTTRTRFMETFEAVAREFEDIFITLFEGGNTKLIITDPSDPLESGIDVHVQLPGKRSQNLLLLSGGERALTTVALIFALLRVRPSPFVVLDEVDAPLDEANVGRFAGILREFAEHSQFIVITHNTHTMQHAHTHYGVTMEQPGVSRLLSMRLEQAEAHAEAQA